MSRPLAMIIDDNKDIAEAFAAVVAMEGYEAEVVLDGETAVSRLAVLQPDLIFLDMYLPGMAGEEVLARIRRAPHLAHTRVVVVTAFPQTARFLSIKPDTVLAKPFKLEQIRHLAARFHPAGNSHSGKSPLVAP